MNNIKMNELKVGTCLQHWFPRTYCQNKYYPVNPYPYITLLTHQCPLLPVWPQCVAKVLPRPVLQTQQILVTSTSHISVVLQDHSKTTQKEHLPPILLSAEQ